jgi:hypothetical protein
MQILDQLQLEHLLVGEALDDHRHRFEAGR